MLIHDLILPDKIHNFKHFLNTFNLVTNAIKEWNKKWDTGWRPDYNDDLSSFQKLSKFKELMASYRAKTWFNWLYIRIIFFVVSKMADKAYDDFIFGYLYEVKKRHGKAGVDKVVAWAKEQAKEEK